MKEDESDVMARLAALVRQPATLRFLEGAAFALRAQLEATPEAKSTCTAVPLDLYGAALPPEVGSSWVFVLRAGLAHPAERHPNSIQRMFGLASAGAMEIWAEGQWVRAPLAPGAADAGLSIPAHGWHRPALLDQAWGVVSFHTVPAPELIEEIGDPAEGRVAASRHYIVARPAPVIGAIRTGGG